MRKLLFSLFLLSIAFNAFSQDKIYLTDNSVVNGKVSEIGLTEIKYKKSENLTGPDYVMPKSKITMIIYENGTHEVINSTAVHTQEENATLLILPYYQTGKNLIGLNYFDLIFKNATLNYTRFLCNYRFSLNVSASLGFTNSENYYNGGTSFLNFDKDYFHSSFSFNYFPIGMNKVSYYTGLTLMTGKGGEYLYDYYGPSILQEKNYYGFYVANGIQFNLSKHFNMRTSLNLGLVDRDMNGDFQSHAMFELSAGIRF
jgi:hypothetical protein